MTGSTGGDRGEIEAAIKAVADELWRMRRGLGIEGANLEDYPAIARYTGDVGLQKVSSVAHFLGESLPAQLFRRALGIHSQGEKNLTQRREAFWREVGQHPVDKKTMDAYERQMAEKLARMLVEGDGTEAFIRPYCVAVATAVYFESTLTTEEIAYLDAEGNTIKAYERNNAMALAMQQASPPMYIFQPDPDMAPRQVVLRIWFESRLAEEYPPVARVAVAPNFYELFNGSLFYSVVPLKVTTGQLDNDRVITKYSFKHVSPHSRPEGRLSPENYFYAIWWEWPDRYPRYGSDPLFRARTNSPAASQDPEAGRSQA